ncbi:MAG: hypothetical protein R3Y22_06760 [Bacteroidales bacterium]
MGLKIIKQIFGVFLLVSFLAYNSGTSLFEHTHIIDGVEVTHSHPYQSNSNHSHSGTSIQFLGLISNTAIAIVAVIIAFKCFRHITATYGTSNDKVSLSSSILYAQLRAPPVA